MENQEILTIMLQINGLTPIIMSKNKTALFITPSTNNELYRYTEPLRYAHLAKYLLIAGHRESMSSLVFLEGLSNDIHVQPFAEVTPDQTNWAANLDLGLKEIIVSTAVFHTPRVFLTLLKSLNKVNKRVILSTLPVINPQSPMDDVSADTKRWAKLTNGIDSEMRKILFYKNDVASIDEYWDYLKWRINAR